MKTYRVFVTRHYIAVDFYDIEAETPRKAKAVARNAAYKLRPNPRMEATDNTWLPDEPVEIKRLGHSVTPFKVKEVYRHKTCGTAFKRVETN